MKIGEETSMDLFAQAIAIDTEEVQVNKSPATGEVSSEIEIWHVVTDFYEDETLVLAAGTKSWPMGKEQAEEVAAALRYIARSRDTKLKRCESCKHWCNSVIFRDQGNSGQCRADRPGTTITSPVAVWPFTDDTDWCSRYFRDPAFEEVL